MVVGSVVDQAARKLRARLQVDPDKQAEETAAYVYPEGIHFDEATYTGDAYPVFGWAACLAEVEVDAVTYAVTVRRLLHAVDVGKAIHPRIVQGQIEGGTLQALGWALCENVVVEDGRVVNRRMTHCIIPTSLDAPALETVIVECPYRHGPHGAKGVGEIPMDGPAAAIANAVADALGIEPDHLPMLPEALLDAVQ
jgi:CO/xanthine dehydrogenase Mo-binding subunit